MDGHYLIPDGVLNLIPFNALIDPQGQALVQTHNIVQLTSARNLVLPPLKSQTTQPIIIAAPEYGTRSVPTPVPIHKPLSFASRTSGSRYQDLVFSPLPGAKKEANDIYQLMQQAQYKPQLWLGNNATEAALTRVQSPSILHLATHGFFLDRDNNENTLMHSGLALFGANQGINSDQLTEQTDGILTALEALRLNLTGTDLVVLSACDTGVGDILQGEGVYGSRRAFQGAGAKAVLSTLWKVNDDATQAFMKRFYTVFLDGMSAQQALRTVQLEFLNSAQWAYPLYWAPFVVVGESKRAHNS